MNFLIYKKNRLKKEVLRSTNKVNVINTNISFLFKDLFI